MNKNYDVVVIGGGPGGYVAAIKASQLGAKVALIEKENIGGICLNHGCIPTKTLLKNVKVYKTVKEAAVFGVNVKGEITVDWTKMIARKNEVVKQLTGGVSFLLKKNNVDVYMGYGEALSAHEVKVGDEVLTTKKLIIATGSSAIVPPIPGVKEAYEKGFVVTSWELLNIKKIPEHLVIVGGGVIGIEFATIFSTLGTKVVIIEKLPTILVTIDEDVRNAYLKTLDKAGIKIITNGEVKEVTQDEVHYVHDGKTHKVKTDLVLMAVGTRANSKGLEKLGLAMDRANIVTDEYLRTNVEDAYAIGDVNGKYMLAHVASHEGLVAAKHATGNKVFPMDYTKVPQAVYGSPEIASVGLTEAQAKEQGRDYETSIFPLVGNGKALADNEKEGFIKIIVDKKYSEVIGAHIFAYQATEMISELVLALNLETSAEELADAIHPHPTLSEIVGEAAMGALGKAIHK